MFVVDDRSKVDLHDRVPPCFPDEGVESEIQTRCRSIPPSSHCPENLGSKSHPPPRSGGPVEKAKVMIDVAVRSCEPSGFKVRRLGIRLAYQAVMIVEMAAACRTSISSCSGESLMIQLVLNCG